nr:putative ribonuclease H-like domain-containing protein [Tanacetum cinerariifolium]
MNYEPVSIEYQSNKSAGPKEANNCVGTQANDDQGVNSKEINLNEEHFVLPICSAYSTTIKSLREKIEKNNSFKTCEKPVSQVEQVFLEDLEKLKRQEKEANDEVESLRKEATHDIQNARTSSTNLIHTTSTSFSTLGPSRAFNDGELLYHDPSKYALPDDPSMPHIKDIYASPSEGIFTGSSYDDEGVVTDFNNLETTVSVSPTPTIRIYTIHPKTQILGDPKSAVQTRGKVNKNSEAYAFICLLERKKLGLNRKKEGIDYDEVFAHVAKIEAIRIFLAFASYMGFIVYQMDVKSSFLYGIIDEEVYVSQPPGFVDPKFPNKTASTPIETQKPLVKDEEAANVDVTPKTSHFHDVKRIFRKSTIGGCQFLGRRLISWQCKKQTIVVTSTTEAEYVAAAHYCRQVLWIQNQLLDYGFNFMNTNIYIDNESTICIVKNLVFHSKTKHIEIRHHFIRDAHEKKLIQVLKIHIDDNVADLLTKAFDVSRFKFLVVNILMINM